MKRKLMLFLTCLFISVGLATAQTQTVTGTVISEEDGQPVVGASVLVKGTTVGTITDIDGNFTLSNVPSSAKTLQVSYIGMQTQDVAIKPNLRIVLKPDSEMLEEVVVTGMQRMDKRLFTGATTSIGGDKAKLDGLPDISRALEGRAAGVSVQNVSGTFGTAPKIRVRGATSIYGSSKPLWVVDGIILEDMVDIDADALSSGDATTLISSAIAGLNADDIESFQILKDGSATSIYGARAMAGVIVVTTKKGKSGVSRINYTGEFTYRMKPNYDNFNIMNSQDQMGVYQEMQQKGWLNLSSVANASESGVYGKMYQLINEGKLMNTEAGKNAYLREAEFRNTDWFDELFTNNIQQNHSVSMSSGNDKASFYASLSALIDPGWSLQSKVNRYTANLNTTYNISQKLSLNVISNASYRKQKAPGTLSRDVDAVSGEVKRDFDINPYSYALNTSRALDPNVIYTRNYADFNILDELDNNFMELNVVDLKFQGELKWKILKGLEASALGAIKYQSTAQEHTISDFSNQAQAYRAMPTTVVRDNNPFLYTDPDNPYAVPITVLPQGGIYQRNDYSMRAYDFRAGLTYNTVIDEKHILNLFGATEINSTERHKTWFRGWGMQYTMGEIPFYAYEVFKKGKEEGTDYYTMGNTESRHVAFIGNGTYSYKGRYTFNGTVRYEGSNKLGKTRSARWLPTWNVSGAWNAHEEEFFKTLPSFLSHFTLKASYSLTADRGPASVTNSQVVIASYNPWRPSSGVTESGLQIDDLENGALTYEKKHELNIGVDLGFLDNRINLAADWYKRDNYDLIGPVNTQGLGGQIVKYGNVASMKSNGVEFTLSTKNIVTKDFKWTTDFTYSHVKNKVTELENKKRVIDMVSGTGFAMEGYPVRSIFSIPFMGLDEEGIPTFLDQNGEVTSTGIYFQERDKVDFLEYSGSADPTDMGGLGNIFEYKNFKLNVFVTYSFGNVIRLDPVFKNSYSDLSSMPKEFKNRWVVPGDENHTDIPVIASNRQNKDIKNLSYAYNAYNYSTARIAKGDFIRMKEISLGYDFPKSLISPWKLESLSLKLQATNLFLIYADKKLNGQDPEFFNTGGVAAPVPKQFTLTLRLGL
ncbi:SusC/RagA family TonB-linked outer membrane protein [Bacteroides sp. 51]|uniref:SusC/RagA family TonB-linked outer membrane protein n=1 Tax=Bacteroides sp. 51 TaxID=2302938 RepID=UPI0013D3A549|nr:SusC/RagA family TonB-linked outer membrane protein [Bacteroides sp. 51]NDV83019.1 SusC/RagA family TonB-linked outer membrane protein [Bacteroides sp. 51]